MKKYYPCDQEGCCPYDSEHIGNCECFHSGTDAQDPEYEEKVVKRDV